MRNMLRAFLLACALLPLGGCTTIQTAWNLATGQSISPNAVYVLVNTYDAAVSSAKNYDSLPTCPTGAPVCKTLSVVKIVDAAVRTGRVARNQLESYVNANPGELVPVTEYQALTTAVQTIQTYVTIH